MSAFDFTLLAHLGGDAAYVWSAVTATLLAFAVETAMLSIRGRDVARHALHIDATQEGR